MTPPFPKAPPGTNGSTKHDPFTGLRAFLGRASPELRAAIATAMKSAETGSRPVALGDVVLALLAETSVSARIPKLRRQKALRLLKNHRADWIEPGRGSFAFDITGLVDRVPAPTDPVEFLATALEPGLLRDRGSEIVRGVLRRLRITPRVLRAPAGPVGGTDLTLRARTDPAPTEIDPRLPGLVAALQAGEPIAVVGEVGVGKTYLVRQLARHVVARTEPLIDADAARWRLIGIARGDLLGGSAAQPDRVIRRLFAHAARNPELVLVFDDAHTVLADPGYGPALAAALRSAGENRVRVVLITSTPEYTRLLRIDDSLHSRLTLVTVGEPELPDLARRLKREPAALLTESALAAGVRSSDEAVDRAIELGAEFCPTERNPKKTAALLRAAVADRTYHVSRGDPRTLVSARDVTAVFAARLNIPPEDLSPEPEDRFARLEAALCARVRGQDHAVSGVIRHLCDRALGNGDPRRPQGRFLLLGPPGCGKTELALCLAELLYRDRAANWVQNLGALQGSAAAYALRGAPAGHIGYGDPTVFTHLEGRPRSVVVFDELDKAPTDVSGCLLDVLDGRARDSRQREVDCSNAIFCFTTNALQDVVTPDTDEDEVRERLVRLGGVFTAPLVDRLDGVFVFNPLTEETLLKILDDLFERRRRGMRRQVPDGVWTRAAKRDIVRRAVSGDRSSSVRRLERELGRYLSRVTAPNKRGTT